MAAKTRISRFHQPLTVARFQPRSVPETDTFQLVQDVMETPREETLTHVSSDGSAQERQIRTTAPNRFFNRFEPKTTCLALPDSRKSRFEPVPVLETDSKRTPETKIRTEPE